VAEVSGEPEAYPGEFLRAEVGSVLYGTNLPGRGDLDLMGVRVESMDEYVRLGTPFEQHIWRSAGGQNPSQAGDVDLTVYGLAKFLRLAVKGNPTIINLLFVPPRMCRLDGALADELRALRPAIVSRESAGRFLGYMKAQRERLMGERGQKHTGAERRKYYIQAPSDAEPWDGKYGSHIIRLGLEGVELLTTGQITFPLSEPNWSKVRGIRLGEMSLAEVNEWAKRLESTLLTFHHDNEPSPLADHPDTAAVESWMRSVYLGAWANRVRYVPKP
jgi:uncharacterized protein